MAQVSEFVPARRREKRREGKRKQRGGGVLKYKNAKVEIESRRDKKKVRKRKTRLMQSSITSRGSGKSLSSDCDWSSWHKSRLNTHLYCSPFARFLFAPDSFSFFASSFLGHKSRWVFFLLARTVLLPYERKTAFDVDVVLSLAGGAVHGGFLFDGVFIFHQTYLFFCYAAERTLQAGMII